MIMQNYTASELVTRNIRQKSIYDWCVEAFAGEDSSPRIRMLRFIEEATELAQAHGLSQTEVEYVVSYVFGRPVGEPYQEVGGVMVTLNCYCEAAGISLVDAEQDEIARVNSKPLEHFQKRQREKTASGLT